MKTTKKLKGCQKGLKSFLIYPFGTLKVLFGKRVGNLRNDDRFLQDRKKKTFPSTFSHSSARDVHEDRQVWCHMTSLKFQTNAPVSSRVIAHTPSR
jgi:hypothetical protein